LGHFLQYYLCFIFAGGFCRLFKYANGMEKLSMKCHPISERHWQTANTLLSMSN
jgi:hypothetical protein